MKIADNQDAQFMLLAGFIIAIGLVITTVMLTSIIFEVNMAVGAGNEPSKNEVINLISVTKDEFRDAYSRATKSGGNINDFSKQMTDFKGNLSKIYARHGESINISWDTTNWNNRFYAYFTDNGTANGAANWTVIENVINSTIVVNISTISPRFNISLTNGTKTWQINFTAPGTRTIDNADIAANITSAYTISFINGANVTGNYSITGNTTYGKRFIRSRDYILNATVTYSNSRVRANITIPVSVPW